MKVTMEKPDIIRFVYNQERSDPHYGSCLWAIFDIDPGRGMLNIQSDCGNYAYRWPERGTDFLKLLAGNMSESYLLDKLCGNPKEFDEEGTIAEIKEYLDEMDLDESRKKRALDCIKSAFEEYTLDDSPELAEFLVDNWNDEAVLNIDCAWELVRKKYGAWQTRIVQIFRDYISPELRKMRRTQKR